MSKRFTDTNKYKKPFFRSLPGAYKLLWDYLYHECDHAGIWIKDFEIAQIYLGKDMPVTEEKALQYFNENQQRIIPVDSGKKWFLPSFIEFQYGDLNPNNRTHSSVISILQREGVKPLASPLQGRKDKDTDKDKDKDKDKESHLRGNPHSKIFTPPTFDDVTAYCAEIDFPGLDARYFIDRNTALGWVDKNGNKYRDWKAMIRTWKKYDTKKTSEIDKLFK